jgi:glycosyltransferase involved in cell wall biosynthesis
MFAYDLTTELLRRDHHVLTVYLYPAHGAHALAGRNQDVMLGANPRHPLERLPGLNPTVLWRLRKIVRSFQPDIVQANGARTLKYGAALRVLSFRHRFGFVYRSIGDPVVWVRGRAKRAFFRWVLIPTVDGIAAVSTTTLDGLHSLYRLDETVVEQVPRGIDPERIAPTLSRSVVRHRLGVDHTAPTIVYVGSLAPEKRPDRLARVFAKVARDVAEAMLIVVGDGPERVRFEALTDQLSIADRVVLVGSTDAVGSFIGAADVLLLTSDTEGLPGAVLEAACLGVPSVATRVGGVADAVADGVNGLLADPEDEDQLSAHVVSLLTDNVLRTDLGQAANEQFMSRYAVSVVADRYLELYDAVTARIR